MRDLKDIGVGLVVILIPSLVYAGLCALARVWWKRPGDYTFIPFMFLIGVGVLVTGAWLIGSAVRENHLCERVRDAVRRVGS